MLHLSAVIFWVQSNAIPVMEWSFGIGFITALFGNLLTEFNDGYRGFFWLVILLATFAVCLVAWAMFFSTLWWWVLR